VSNADQGVARLQRQNGYRPRDALHDLAECLNVLFFEVDGVALSAHISVSNHPPAPLSGSVPTCTDILPVPKLSEPPCKWHVTVSDGLARLKARASRRMTRGSMFVFFHFKEATANVSTTGGLDLYGKIPERKSCIVRVERLD
jgi:hypothetical protein